MSFLLLVTFSQTNCSLFYCWYDPPHLQLFIRLLSCPASQNNKGHRIQVTYTEILNQMPHTHKTTLVQELKISAEYLFYLFCFSCFQWLNTVQSSSKEGMYLEKQSHQPQKRQPSFHDWWSRWAWSEAGILLQCFTCSFKVLGVRVVLHSLE